MELFARVDTNSEAYKNGLMIGVMLAMTVCGLIPLVQGIRSRQPLLGVMGGFLTAVGAWFLGCLGGLPIAFFFSFLIRSLPEPEQDEDSLRAEVERQRQREWRDY